MSPLTGAEAKPPLAPVIWSEPIRSPTPPMQMAMPAYFTPSMVSIAVAYLRRRVRLTCVRW